MDAYSHDTCAYATIHDICTEYALTTGAKLAVTRSSSGCLISGQVHGNKWTTWKTPERRPMFRARRGSTASRWSASPHPHRRTLLDRWRHLGDFDRLGNSPNSLPPRAVYSICTVPAVSMDLFKPGDGSDIEWQVSKDVLSYNIGEIPTHHWPCGLSHRRIESRESFFAPIATSHTQLHIISPLKATFRGLVMR